MARWLSWLERRPVTAEVVGSNPIRVAISIIYNLYRGGRKHIKLAFSTSYFFLGILAQLGEHLPYKQRVTGSSPVGPIYTVRSINDKNEYADLAQFRLIDLVNKR